MVNNVRVYGKAQNRTALGIINAYKVMNPHATFEDFVKAFPKELNPDNGWDVIFKRFEEIDTENESSFFFVEEDEVITLSDGTIMTVCKMWTKPSFDKLAQHAEQYGIEIAEFERGMKGHKGGFRLEYLNGYVPPIPVGEEEVPVGKNHKVLWTIIIVLLLLCIAALIYFLKGCNAQPEAIVTHDTTEVVVRDTIYMEKIEEIETNFNAANFEQNLAILNDDAKFVLHDLVQLMEKNPEVKLKIEGHTSAEGDADVNQKLSEARAKVTVDFLISQGIDSTRLSFEGKGSRELKNADNPMAEENRRTEFIVLK